MFRYYKQGFTIFKQFAGESIGYVFLMLFLYALLLVISTNRFANAIVYTLFAPLSFGLSLFLYRFEKTGASRFSNLFDGLRHHFLSINILFFFQSIVFSVIFSSLNLIDVEMLNSFVTSKGAMKISNEQMLEVLNAVQYALGIFLVINILLGFSPYFLYFRNQGVITALNSSIQFGVKNLFGIISLNIQILFLNILGLLPCFTGLFVTIPMSIFMYYIFFKEHSIPMVSDQSTNT